MTEKPTRSTNIGCLFLNTVGSSSVAHFGDNQGSTALTSRAIAVQRAIPVSERDEARFAAYEIFTRPSFVLTTGVDVDFQTGDRSPDLRIGSVQITALSSGSLLRAGCSGPIHASTRVKHIRHFNQPENRDIR